MAVQEKLEQVIKQIAPSAEFELEVISGRLSGAVIASEFEDLTPLQRQQRVWDRIREQLGSESTQVGMLFLYTPEEAEILPEDDDA
jgi:acid stress-induced BolA-like protein IbaG/YrbA